MAKPFGYLNPRRDHAFVAILRDHAPSRALAKDRKIFFGHEQPMLRQLWNVIFQVVHRFRAGNVVWQMAEEVAKHFPPQDLMNPYLEPGFSLEVDIAERILKLVRIES